MSFESRMSGSIHGREFGLQRMSSVEMGSSFPGVFLVGSEAIRQNVATADTTAGILRPFGLVVGSSHPWATDSRDCEDDHLERRRYRLRENA